MSSNKIIALVPMRHHSQRVEGKNYRELGGKPLFHHILHNLSQCQEIHQIAVDTDSPIIKENIEKDFSKVHIINRPQHLCADDIPMNEILLYDVNQLEGDFFLQTHTTNPLLKAETIASAINTFFQNFPAYDSLFSVTRLQTRLWDKLARPINHNPDILLQTQDLPPIFEENSCIYIFTKQNLESRRNRIGNRPYLFPINPLEAIDIDEEWDFQIADVLMNLEQDK